MLEFLILPSVILIFLTTTVLLISWDWRISILSLGIQYVCVFVLISNSYPIETAAVKIVAGWMGSAILGLAIMNNPQDKIIEKPAYIADVVFRLIAAVLAGLFAFTGGARLVTWLPDINVLAAYGALILISIGLLHLAFTNHPFRVVISLLTILSGFEVIYAGIESSILITGLLAVVTLGLAVLGAYMVNAPALEDAN